MPPGGEPRNYTNRIATGGHRQAASPGLLSYGPFCPALATFDPGYSDI